MWHLSAEGGITDTAEGSEAGENVTAPQTPKGASPHCLIHQDATYHYQTLGKTAMP